MSDTRVPIPPEPDEIQIARVALSAELLHELTNTKSFLCVLLDALRAGRPLSANTLEIAEHEAGRIERLLGHLRTIRLPPLALSAISLQAALQEAMSAAAPLLQKRGLSVHIEGPETLAVHAEPAMLALALQHLLGFVATHAAPQTQVAVRLVPGSGGAVSMEIASPAQQTSEGVPPLFNPWSNDRAQIGLGIAHRLFRAWSWSIRPQAQPGHIGFRIEVPAPRKGSAS